MNYQRLNLLTVPKQIIDLTSKPSRISRYLKEMVQEIGMVGKCP
jgi:hypothetical protein